MHLARACMPIGVRDVNENVMAAARMQQSQGTFILRCVYIYIDIYIYMNQ